MIYNFRYHSQHREDRTVRREAKTWEIIIIIWDSFLLMSLIIKMKNITQMLLLFLLFVSLSFCYKNSLRFPSASRNKTFCLRSSSVCWVQAPFRSCVFQMSLNKQKWQYGSVCVSLLVPLKEKELTQNILIASEKW